MLFGAVNLYINKLNDPAAGLVSSPMPSNG